MVLYTTIMYVSVFQSSTASTITVTIRPPSQPNGIVRYYNVCLCLSEFYSLTITVTIQPPSQPNSIVHYYNVCLCLSEFYSLHHNCDYPTTITTMFLSFRVLQPPHNSDYPTTITPNGIVHYYNVCLCLSEFYSLHHNCDYSTTITT